MNIFAIIHDEITACEHIRVFQPLRELNKFGHNTGYATATALLKAGRRGKLPWLGSDIILMNRLSVKPEDMPEVSSVLDFTRMMLGPKSRFIFDTDDDLTGRYRDIYKGSGVIPNLIQFDRVIVTVPWLADVMKDYHPLISVVPNFVDCLAFAGKPKLKPEDMRLTVGLTGSKTHVEDWRPVVPALNRIRETHGVRVLVSGFVPQGLEGYTTLNDIGIPAIDHTLPYPLYPQSLRQYDIVCAPLDPLDKFNASKSNIKYLECASSARQLPSGEMGGIAFIATPAHSVYTDTVRHQKTGLLVRNNEPDEWYACLKLLVENEKLRLEIQKQCHYEVMHNWDIANHGVLTYQKMFQNVLKSPAISQRFSPDRLRRYLHLRPMLPQSAAHPLQDSPARQPD